jgi:hypothetical protein
VGNNKNEVMDLKKHIFFHRFLAVVISAAMIFCLTSCSPQQKPAPSAEKTKKQENKPPKELDDLSKAVEKMEKTLFNMNERSKKPLFIQQQEIAKQKKSDQVGSEQGSQNQSGSGNTSEKRGENSGEKSSGGGQKSQQSTQIELTSPEEKLTEYKYESQQMKLEIDRTNLEELEKLKKEVIELHSLWNAFEAKAISQFVMQTSINEFESALNNLTNAIKQADTYQSVLQVTQMYKYLPDFYLVYSYEAPPELGKIRFAAKKIYLVSEKGNYGAAQESLDYLSGVWLLTRPKLNEDSKDLIHQFEFAVSDLKAAIDGKNDTIIAAKTEVIIKVADEVEKLNKKKK